MEKITFIPNSPPYKGGVAPASGDGVVLSHATDQASLSGQPAAQTDTKNRPVGETPPPLLCKEGCFGRIFFNETQYFEGVPEIAWNFYIGGYQPAQKWLKDRKGRILNYDDIQHYQEIIVALTETDRIMKQIDKVKLKICRYAVYWLSA